VLSLAYDLSVAVTDALAGVAAAEQSRLSASANQRGRSLLGVTVMGTLSALIVCRCVAATLAGTLLSIAQTKDAVLGDVALFSMALGMGVLLVVVGVTTPGAAALGRGWKQ
jgi:thioredoxin:protein disulfide reductase